MFNKVHAFFVYGTIVSGLTAWFLLISGALVWLAGYDHGAEGIFAAAGWTANVSMGLLLGACALADPDR